MGNNTNSSSKSGEPKTPGERPVVPHVARYTAAVIGLLLVTGFSLFILTGGWSHITSRFSHPSGSQKHMSSGPTPRKQVPEAYRNRSSPEPNSSLLRKGKNIYEDHCVACHGENGTGDGPVSTGLNPKPKTFSSTFLQQVSDQFLFWRVSEGKPNTAMPAFKQVLSPKERWSVIRYIRTIARED